MRIFFSVGEPSGDLHGSNLIRRLKSEMPKVECTGFGGPKMAAAGCQLHFDLTELAVMFIGAVVKNIRLFFRLIGQTDSYFANNDIDAVVLIDYPGFNWWIARKAKKHGIPVFYYGIPQVWAWAPWRVRKIRRYIDHVLCKLPFEVEWFVQRKCHAIYVGHPYFDQLEQQTYDDEFVREFTNRDGKLVTLLPGSRDQEVKNVLPILLNAAQLASTRIENCRVAIACYNQRQKEVATEMVNSRQLPFEVFVDRTPELMKAADACIACSGSVSLELLYHRKPTVIVYKVKRWIMAAQAMLLRTKFITLVNLIATDNIRKQTWSPYDPDAIGADPAVMPEYLTTGDPAQQVASQIQNWFSDEKLYQAKVTEMDQLARKFAKPGATQRAADYILQQMRKEDAKSESGKESDSNNLLAEPNEQAAA